MKSLSPLKLGTAVAMAAAMLAAAPAAAQKDGKKPAAPAISKEESAALVPLQNAIKAGDLAAAAAALPAAQAAAQSPDAKYFVASFQYQIATKTKDQAMQITALEAMLASGKVPAESQAKFYSSLGTLANATGDTQKSSAAFAKLLELNPNDADAVMNLATIKNNLKQTAEVLPLVDRAIQLKTAAGQPVPESWYRLALQTSLNGKMAPQALKYGQALIKAYPSEKSWKDAMLVYRRVAKLDQPSTIDLLRLMRASKTMGSDNDYFELADALRDVGLPGEVKAVLDEGSRAGVVDVNRSGFKDLLTLANGQIAEDRASLPSAETQAMSDTTGKNALATANTYLSYGDYAKAASLYRAALQKGSVDTNLANSRLGVALALAGQKAEADAAFANVTGQRAEVASFWRLWLSQRS